MGMSESEARVQATSEAAAPMSLIQDIYTGVKSSEEQKLISGMKEFYERNDTVVVGEIEQLRAELGNIEGWKSTKEKAKQELESVPSDVLERILKEFSPFIKNLPAGHSRGHFLRDTSYLSLIMHDSSIVNSDLVEIFVGLLGGMYHDIGNSVVDRYQEAKRFSGHAEIGAHLFGEVSKGLIGDNLRKMAQLAIAGHTHYLKDRTVTKGTETKTVKPYEDEVVDGNRISFWWTRQSDRMDAQGPIMDVRHMVTKAEPTEDFDGKEFHATWDNPSDDFKHQFTPTLRTNEERANEPKPKNTMNVLEHVTMFANSNFNPDLPYAKHDNALYKDMVSKAADEQKEFVHKAATEFPQLTPEARDAAFRRYFRLVSVIEPADNTEDAIQKMKSKFKLLPENDQDKWAGAFDVLTKKLYPQMHKRIKGVLDAPIVKINERGQTGASRVQDILDNHLQVLSRDIWNLFDPSKIAA